MIVRDDIGIAPRAWALARRALFAAALPALSGCGMGGGAGALLVDPGRYNAYHCNDLAARWKVLVAREKDLRALMERASEGGGGAVIGSLAYRSDYESVLGEERLLQRAAAEKNCGLTPQFQSSMQPQGDTQFQSDQTIR